MKLESFPLSSVRITSGDFLRAQEADMKYILSMDMDRLLAPFLIDAGIDTQAEKYGNWENTGLDGHMGGHYLSALSMMYASTGNQQLLFRLNYMIDKLKACQDKNGNGYVGGIPGGQAMWQDVAKGNIEAGGFSLNQKWVPLYNIHKLFAGLKDAYWYADNQVAKQMLIDLTDWFLTVNSQLSDEQIQDMLRSEHGGLNEVFADVYEITGDRKYLDLAKRYSHQEILQPLLAQRDELTGLHANTQIPKVIGFERIAELGGDKDWSKASQFFWNDVVRKRTVSIGGNSVREHFNPLDDFSSMIESNQGPETCNTYNMLRLSKMLFLEYQNSECLDYYERATFNHILSSQHPDGGFVYFTPMRPRHYRVYSQPDLDFWCCVGSGLENHGKYGELIYAHQGDDIMVNLFIPSQLQWQEKGLKLIQNTTFPYEEGTSLKLALDSPREFKLSVRAPKWAESVSLKVNNEPITYTKVENGYIGIERVWKNGDLISVSLPMKTTVEYLPSSTKWGSIVHGPIVLAAATDTTNLDGLWADDSRMSHVAAGQMYPIDEAPVLIARNTGEILSGIKPSSNEPMTFKVDELVFPKKYSNLKLIPFYKVHEARYMVYWPILNEQEFEKRQDEIRESERAMLALEAKTVDQVATGEQQPESDHNFKGERTDSGINAGSFWRHAEGWFSYELKNPEWKGKVLRVTYATADAGRNFDIFINGQLLAHETLQNKRSELYDKDYTIPDKLLKAGKQGIMELKFQASPGSIAGGVYHIRLLVN